MLHAVRFAQAWYGPSVFSSALDLRLTYGGLVLLRGDARLGGARGRAAARRSVRRSPRPDPRPRQDRARLLPGRLTLGGRAELRRRGCAGADACGLGGALGRGVPEAGLTFAAAMMVGVGLTL